MKKRLLGFLICTMLVSMCVGCGAESTTTEQSEITTAITAEDTTAEQTSETTEESHTHNYTEEITTDATCEADGLKTFTCECGDTYTEAIIASGVCLLQDKFVFIVSLSQNVLVIANQRARWCGNPLSCNASHWPQANQ